MTGPVTDVLICRPVLITCLALVLIEYKRNDKRKPSFDVTIKGFKIVGLVVRIGGFNREPSFSSNSVSIEELMFLWCKSGVVSFG